MNMLIQGGRVIDPSCQMDQLADVRIAEGVITQIAPGLVPDADETVLDAAGRLITPGLVDIHVHLREPGYEYKETIATGAAAAVAGGFTAVCCMANTDPVADNAAVLSLIREKARAAGLARVYPVGAVTKGLQGEALSEMGELAAAGCVAFSDDGKPVRSGRMMGLAMQYAAQFGKKILVHAEDLDLLDGGVMNAGAMATALGLRGAMPAAEEAAIARDLLLAKAYNIPIHICHVSTAGGVALLRQAKAAGVPVTAETAPHYLCGTEALCAGFDTHGRVNPPLRRERDTKALIEGLRDGTLDCIASDHAPHHVDEKQCEFDLAASGICGLETSLALTWTTLTANGFSPAAIIRLMSTAPASILGLPGGTLSPGAAADITVLDPAHTWTIDPSAFYSKGHNTPFAGRTVTCKATEVLVGGRLVLKNGKVV